MTTRRNVLGVIAAMPIAAAAGSKALASVSGMTPAVVAETSVYPFGFMVDSFELAPQYPYLGAHSPVMAMHVRMIWDGKQFVRFDSPDGTAVLNRLLQGRPAVWANP